MKPLYRQPVLLFGIIFTALIAVQSYYLRNTAQLWRSEIYRDVYNRLDKIGVDNVDKINDENLTNLIVNFRDRKISQNHFHELAKQMQENTNQQISAKIDSAFASDGYKVGVEVELSSIFLENTQKYLLNKPLILFRSKNHFVEKISLSTDKWATTFKHRDTEVPSNNRNYEFIIKKENYYGIQNINTILFKKLAPQILLNILLCGFILYIFSKTLKNLRQQNQKIAQLHTTIDAITHELNTPVTTLKFALKNQNSSAENPLINRQIQKIEEIVAGIHHSSTNSVLLSEKMLDGYFEKIKIDFPHIQFNISKNFIQNKTLTESDFKLIMDNLIGNSAKYGATEISIETLFENSIKMSVKDNGIGIPSHELKIIFDKYYRINNTENSTKSGLGLGLYLVKTAVEKYGGTITAQAVLPNGVLFKIGML